MRPFFTDCKNSVFRRDSQALQLHSFGKMCNRCDYSLGKVLRILVYSLGKVLRILVYSLGKM